MAGEVGRFVLRYCRTTGQGILLMAQAFACFRFIFTQRARRELVNQIYAYGWKSVGVVTVVALFTGMILALQTGIELRRFNQEVNIGTAVMVSMLREMGPFMTGQILAACVGSAIAAQIGTMTVSEEVAALEIMSIDPVRFLVMPRLMAMLIVTPALSLYTCFMGLVGGGIVGETQLGVTWSAYMDNATMFATGKDLYVGQFKAFLFAIIITVVACHEGFVTKQGAVGVGRATRRTVIVSFLYILMMGYFVTRLFYVL
jgi:phospholipid/cholesterol/gamma-HCH transport system permease protein